MIGLWVILAFLLLLFYILKNGMVFFFICGSGTFRTKLNLPELTSETHQAANPKHGPNGTRRKM